MHSILKWIGTWDWGNVADWVSGVGTILAIFVSLFVLFYQIKKVGEQNRKSFFSERNVKTLDDAEEQVINITKKLTRLNNNLKNSSDYTTERKSEWDADLEEILNDLSLVSALINRFVEDKNVENIWPNINASTKVVEGFTAIKNFKCKVGKTSTKEYQHLEKNYKDTDLILTDIQVSISEARRTVY